MPCRYSTDESRLRRDRMGCIGSRMPRYFRDGTLQVPQGLQCLLRRFIRFRRHRLK
jgi:hypothetical protein